MTTAEPTIANVDGAPDNRGTRKPHETTEGPKPPVFPLTKKQMISGSGLLLLGLLCVWFFTFGFEWSNPGEFGDSLSPIVGLVTAGALVAAVWSVRLQRHEIEIQREELRNQLEEMRASRQQLSQQAKHMKRLTRAQDDANRIQKETNRLMALSAKAELLSARVQSRASKLDALGVQMDQMQRRGRSDAVWEPLLKDSHETVARFVAELGGADTDENDLGALKGRLESMLENSWDLGWLADDYEPPAPARDAESIPDSPDRGGRSDEGHSESSRGGTDGAVLSSENEEE